MTTNVNTVVVGGGQAGLSVSHYLTKHAVDHVVLERADRPGDAWRNRRWDSFTLNTPRWQSRFPGVRYGEDDPDGFMPKREVVAQLDELARRLPVRTRARVTSIRRHGGSGCYLVKIDDGETIRARNVVVATGLYQSPKIPAFADDLPRHLKQLHSDSYHNPEELLPGAVLVVGSAQSGAQIAEELYESGRNVYLATGRAGRTPRRYRGKDANWWFARMGQYDRKVSELPSPKAKFSGKPHISGTKGGHPINLHQFARDGVILLGHLAGVEGSIIKLKRDLHDNLAAADRAEAEFVKAVDVYIAARGIAAPEETLPVLRDGFDQEILTELDVCAAGITNVIWATGYSFDFSMIELPVADSDGFPIQTRGVTAFPGLFFVGLPWLHTAKSGLIYGLSEDARYIADRIVERRDAEDEHAITIVLPQDIPPEHKRSRATTRWADRARQHNGTTAMSVQPRKLNMSRRFAILASTAIITLSTAAGYASETPLPPRVSFVGTPADQLRLGMTADDVNRVMGEAVRETNSAIGSIQLRKLEFTDAIPDQVILSDGRVSRVILDPFRMENDALPSFIRQAWPGHVSSAVRRALGVPAVVLRYTFFGIDVDQWIFCRPGDGDVSVFFRGDRVIAREVGREIPSDLFRVKLPSPRDAEVEARCLWLA